ncbi:MAG TPA: GNAT family N-acetyltransferase [Tepidisphaeraceae bacterium]
MQRMHREYELSDDRSRIDLDRVHRWLSSSYWSPGVRRDVVERAMHGSSLIIGAFLHNEQIGYARVVSDKATFAWIADVYVDESHRCKGVARAMVGFALNDPQHQNLRRWLLATKDAHGVYAALGFAPLSEPQRFMYFRPDPSGWSNTPP